MIYETKKYVETLVRLEITPNQFLFCWLLYNKEWELMKYYMEKFGTFGIKEIHDLADKDVIVLLNKGSDKLIPSEIVVTERFAFEMIVDSEDAWEELIKTYPAKLVVNGVQFAARGMTLNDEKELKQRYTDYIKKNKYEHQNIISLVQKWKDKNGGFAVMKIDKFITSKYWLDLEVERDNYVGPALL